MVVFGAKVNIYADIAFSGTQDAVQGILGQIENDMGDQNVRTEIGEIGFIVPPYQIALFVRFEWIALKRLMDGLVDGVFAEVVLFDGGLVGTQEQHVNNGVGV